MWGYFLPQVLNTFVELGIADLLAEGPATAEELASRAGADAPYLYRLLRVAAALDLVTLDAGVFSATETTTLLQNGSPGSIRDFVLFYGSEDTWASWGALDYCVRTGSDAYQHLHGEGFFEVLAKHPNKQATFNKTMAGISRRVAQVVRDNPSVRTRKRLIDVGGGNGALLAGILAANADMRGVVYDTESGLSKAPAELAAAGVLDRCEIVSGDFFTSIPSGGDGYLLKHIVHDWDDERATLILENCRAAMTSESLVYLVESIVPDDPADYDVSSLVLDLNMMVTLPGKYRTRAEYAELLQSAGLRLDSVSPLPAPGDPYHLLVASPR